MIDIRKLKELVRLMVNNELTELDLRDSEEQVTLRRGPGPGGSPVVVSPSPAAVAAAPAVAAPAEETPAAADDGLVPLVSPMVGTFYSAANPDASPFVNVGSAIDADTVVCMMEAMKIFNEIKAEMSGTIEKVLVTSGEAVEFGQPLFLVKPG